MVWHRQSKRCEARISGDGVDKLGIDGLASMNSVVTERVLVKEPTEQVHQPVEIGAGSASPQDTRMLGMGGLVGAGGTVLMHDGAEDLAGLQDHLDAMPITVHLSGDAGVGVKYENVHTYIILHGLVFRILFKKKILSELLNSRNEAHGEK